MVPSMEHSSVQKVLDGGKKFSISLKCSSHQEKMVHLIIVH